MVIERHNRDISGVKPATSIGELVLGDALLEQFLGPCTLHPHFKPEGTSRGSMWYELNGTLGVSFGKCNFYTMTMFQPGL